MQMENKRPEKTISPQSKPKHRLSEKQLKEVLILALVRAMPDMIEKKVQQGRIKNLYHKLVAETDRLLGFYSKMTDADAALIEAKLKAWSKKTRWHLGTGKHVCTVSSFLLCVIEDHLKTGGRLLSILTQISTYFERAGNKPEQSDWAGHLAANRFDEVFSDS